MDPISCGGTLANVYYSNTSNRPNFKVEASADYAVDENGDRTGSVNITLVWYIQLPNAMYNVPIHLGQYVDVYFVYGSANPSLTRSYQYRLNNSTGYILCNRGEWTAMKSAVVGVPDTVDGIFQITNLSATMAWSLSSSSTTYSIGLYPNSNIPFVLSSVAHPMTLTRTTGISTALCDESPLKSKTYNCHVDLPQAQVNSVSIQKKSYIKTSFKTPSAMQTSAAQGGTYTDIGLMANNFEPGVTYFFNGSIRYPYGSPNQFATTTDEFTLPQYTMLVKKDGEWIKAIPCVKKSSGWTKVYPLGKSDNKWQMGWDYAKDLTEET